MRSALLGPPVTQETADVLHRAFAPHPGAQLISILVDERRRRIDLEFRFNGQIAKCAVVLEKRVN